MPPSPSNFSTPIDLRAVLDSLQCSDRLPISPDNKYLSPLKTLTSEFGCSAIGGHGLENTLALASSRHRDLLVVLQEPINGASYLPPQVMFEQSEAMKWLDIEANTSKSDVDGYGEESISSHKRRSL
jgi:hypothetical protein